MARKDGHNIGCGVIIAIEIVCTIIVVVISSMTDLGVKNPIGPIFVGLILGYIVASYVNSSDRFKDL